VGCQCCMLGDEELFTRHPTLDHHSFRARISIFFSAILIFSLIGPKSNRQLYGIFSKKGLSPIGIDIVGGTRLKPERSEARWRLQ
jgi:hypothetical protein